LRWISWALAGAAIDDHDGDRVAARLAVRQRVFRDGLGHGVGQVLALDQLGACRRRDQAGKRGEGEPI